MVKLFFITFQKFITTYEPGEPKGFWSPPNVILTESCV